MKIAKIISDGTVCGNRVVDDEGRDLTGLIKRIEWSVEAGGIPRLLVEFIGVEVESSIPNPASDFWLDTSVDPPIFRSRSKHEAPENLAGE